MILVASTLHLCSIIYTCHITFFFICSFSTQILLQQIISVTLRVILNFFFQIFRYFILFFRHFWQKYRRNHTNTNGLVGDNSTDPLAVKSRTVSADEVSIHNCTINTTQVFTTPHTFIIPIYI